MGNKVVMTVHGKELLEKELEHLIRVERATVKQEISQARALGDLKENAEYHAAKEKQGHIEGRVLEIQAKINSSEVVDLTKLSGGKIVFGATVTLYDEAKQQSMTYQIVGDDESQTAPDKVSYNSPLGRSLIGLEAGDTAYVKAPKGDREYEITEVSY